MSIPAHLFALERLPCLGRLIVGIALLITLPPPAPAERLPIKTYTTSDGLPGGQINCILRDSKGFLWFCTSEGLSRFDGYKFTNYSTAEGLANRLVVGFIETRSGVYLAAAGDSVCTFSPKAGDGNPRKFFTCRQVATGPKNGVAAIMEHAGAVWCATGRGLYKLDEPVGELRFQYVDLGQQSEIAWLSALAAGANGEIWVSSGSQVFRHWPDGRTDCYTPKDWLSASIIHVMLSSTNGELWIGTSDGLARVAIDSASNLARVIRIYNTKDGLPNSWINALYQSSDGRVWIGTDAGLSVVDSGNAQINAKLRAYTVAQGFSDKVISAFGEDSDGNLWIGTETGGAMKLARDGFVSYNEADGLGDGRIGSLFADHSICDHQRSDQRR